MAVLTPYRAQLGLLRSRISSALPRKSLQLVEFATVDGFQVWRSLWATTHTHKCPSNDYHSRQCSSGLRAGQQKSAWADMVISNKVVQFSVCVIRLTFNHVFNLGKGEV